MAKRRIGDGWVAFIVAVVVILVVVGAGLLVPKIYPDETQYWEVGQTLLRTGSYSGFGSILTAYKPPMMAWLSAGLLAAGIQMSAAKLMMSLFAGIVAALVFLGIRRLAPDRSPLVGAVGALLVCANPAFVYTASTLYPQVILAVLSLLMIWVLTLPVGGIGRRPTAEGLLLGLLIGLGMLTSGDFAFGLLGAAIVAVFLWITRHRSDRAAWRSALTLAAAMVLMAAIVLAPWVIRNNRDVHPGIYISTNSGDNLLRGNNENAKVDSGPDVDLSAYFARIPPDTGEYERDQLLRGFVFENWRSNPGYYARFYVEKLLFGLGNSTKTFTFGSMPMLDLILWAYYIPLWFGVLVWMWVAARRPDRLRSMFGHNARRIADYGWIALGAWVVNWAGHAVFFSRLRYRLPMDVALAPIAVFGFLIILSMVADRRAARRGVAVGSTLSSQPEGTTSANGSTS